MSNMENTVKNLMPKPQTPPITRQNPIQSSEKYTRPPRDGSLEIVSRDRTHDRSVSPSPRPSRDSSPKEKPQKKVTFNKDVKRDDYGGQTQPPNYNAKYKCNYF